MKHIFILIFFLFSAWTWPTHENIAEHSVSLLTVKDKINITELKRGARAPDEVFSDFQNHQYPPSLFEAEKWIAGAKQHVYEENYAAASYEFGVASHYITDSFAAPHNVVREGQALHSRFENQVKKYVPITPCQRGGYDLFFDLDRRKKGKKDWQIWVITRDERIPQREVEAASKLLSSIAMDVFNSTCNKYLDSPSHTLNNSPIHVLFNIFKGFF